MSPLLFCKDYIHSAEYFIQQDPERAKTHLYALVCLISEIGAIVSHPQMDWEIAETSEEEDTVRVICQYAYRDFLKRHGYLFPAETRRRYMPLINHCLISRQNFWAVCWTAYGLATRLPLQKASRDYMSWSQHCLNKDGLMDSWEKMLPDCQLQGRDFCICLPGKVVRYVASLEEYCGVMLRHFED